MLIIKREIAELKLHFFSIKKWWQHLRGKRKRHPMVKFPHSPSYIMHSDLSKHTNRGVISSSTLLHQFSPTSPQSTIIYFYKPTSTLMRQEGQFFFFKNNSKINEAVKSKLEGNLHMISLTNFSKRQSRSWQYKLQTLLVVYG